jgi:mgtE-like transporter
MMAREVNVRPIVVQGLSVLFLCALIELCAGGVFKGMHGYFTTLMPGLIVMVPPLLDLRGNINGALASRLGTALNAGLIQPRLSLSNEVKVNLASSLILSILASATIGIFAFGVNVLTGASTIGLLELMAIAVIAGFTSGLILAILTVLVAVKTYSRGWDPDNVTSPTMATVGDFVTIGCIYMAVLLVVA